MKVKELISKLQDEDLEKEVEIMNRDLEYYSVDSIWGSCDGKVIIDLKNRNEDVE